MLKGKNVIQIYYGNEAFGPGKVVQNLTRGLQILKVDYYLKDGWEKKYYLL